ncbi:MerR family transcriptional regulator [Brevibacillus porteri]|uniref:MerR family transcriptional regulator n=1 Tax=Brevibacillus porteri TaxID=2126350 RepID=A0ABX5FYU6_9BACL|nr:MerR family DNA-binding transcriptional regulator [Brevibacillus porteri]MED1800941.1 MerR family DNA-binding transcriptional regulator [Brevibacillus porteri]MED2130327.1 MerR family DNA-binding transcriptional regulator [Brevibacillus porteri]MED2742830.1 MerR family DNA-binding transcriptional regulator [Brevibacillus porteri]MED2817290.1 MerR family DNA-binding transcriptional regulator [Brevibacillus porteri]MED2895954.1 MerR family DNA-binding transcriptional regulator [Brevibacillus 
MSREGIQKDESWTISDLAQQVDVSTRTIRYYEELGLIFPSRTEKGSRYYNRKDRARLRLILRGKRFGFSLDQIREMIELFDEDRTGRAQLLRTIEYGNQKLAEIDEKIMELRQLREDILVYKQNFEQKLLEENEEEKR